MQIITTFLPGVLIIEPKIFGDERGFFMETYRKDLFEQAGIPTNFVQDNHSGSRQGILRGLHYQIRQPQGKLFRVVAGEVFDVAVDLRHTSPTCGQWFGAKLSAQNRKQIWVPVGFAHGFLVLSEWAEVVYKTTDFYAPEWERCLAWNDPQVGVDWPLPEGTQPSLSAKDARGQRFAELELF